MPRRAAREPHYPWTVSTGKTHIALGLGLAACQKGLTVRFITASSLVHELMEVRDEKRLLRLQKSLAKVSLLIIDELGFVPLPKTGAELLFELIARRYETGSTLITSNLPFEDWTETFGTERLSSLCDVVMNPYFKSVIAKLKFYQFMAAQNSGLLSDSTIISNNSKALCVCGADACSGDACGADGCVIDFCSANACFTQRCGIDLTPSIPGI